MLKNRILSTLKFFDLQDYPLTLLELHKFLITDTEILKYHIDGQGEVVGDRLPQHQQARMDEILNCLDAECLNEVQSTLGFYHLKNRSEIAHARWENYFFGIKRERLIKRYIRFLKYIPFVRGAALGGSQAMGLNKPGSDIDLFIITEPKFMWLARTLVTVYFQILGKRRYGKSVANRFCLNHYVAGPKSLDQIKNLYSAMEYGRLRPLVYGQAVARFQQNNQWWIKQLFPNWRPFADQEQGAVRMQKFLEKLFFGKVGLALEWMLKNLQEPRIKKGQFIIVQDDELSFHPDSKQKPLLEKFLFS